MELHLIGNGFVGVGFISIEMNPYGLRLHWKATIIPIAAYDQCVNLKIMVYGWFGWFECI